MNENDIWAPWYDELHEYNDPTDCVDFLHGLAAPDPVVEFAVGTGRVAIPLARRGHRVFGIDISSEMIARLAVKANSNVTGIIADATVVTLPECAGVAYIVFNSLYALADSNKQELFFCNAYRQMLDGGLLVVEAFVPDHSRAAVCRVHDRSPTRRTIVSTKHNLVSQKIDVEVMYLRDNEIHRLFAPTRYIYLSEMDLMARMAGFRLVDRFGGWKHEPLNDQGGNAISVFKKVSQPTETQGRCI